MAKDIEIYRTRVSILGSARAGWGPARTVPSTRLEMSSREGISEGKRDGERKSEICPTCPAR